MVHLRFLFSRPHMPLVCFHHNADGNDRVCNGSLTRGLDGWECHGTDTTLLEAQLQEAVGK